MLLSLDRVLLYISDDTVCIKRKQRNILRSFKKHLYFFTECVAFENNDLFSLYFY